MFHYNERVPREAFGAKFFECAGALRFCSYDYVSDFILCDIFLPQAAWPSLAGDPFSTPSTTN